VFTMLATTTKAEFMRLARIKAAEGQVGVYHCMSRIVGAQHLLDDVCKEKFVALMHPLLKFCEIEIITYCVMSNHFHVLVRVPPRRDSVSISDTELLEKLRAFYGKKGVWTVLAQECLDEGRVIDPRIRDAVLSRIGDVSVFIQELKQRFSLWYNRLHERTGYLWGERFKSVIVEDRPSVIQTVAAYIDLNPVRAGLVEDPKDYRFSGYAAALAGNGVMRKGLMSCLAAKSWSQASAEYRMSLYVKGGNSGRADKRALDPEAIKAELARGGELALGEILRLRIRHMTDGVILGSKGFVDEMWMQHREKFGARRKSGARPIRGAPIPGIAVLRDLQVNGVG
jgi:putative transposase